MTHSHPLVSVIITTYNRAALLGEAIESVQAQSYSSWELIIINDGSKDHTSDVMRQYAQRDNRIHCMNQENHGLAFSRTKGVELAKGDYIAFLDDDDAFLPEKLRRQVEYLENNQQVGFVYSSVNMIDGNKNFLKTWPLVPALTFKDLARVCTIQPNGILVRSSVIKPHLPFNPRVGYADDYEMWLRISRTNLLGFLPEPVGVYRRHDQNATVNRKNQIGDLVRVYKSLLHELNLTSEERKQVNDGAIFTTYICANQYLSEKNYHDAFFYYISALRFSPFVGNLTHWSRFSNPVYRFLRPYGALFYCLLAAITGVQNKTSKSKVRI